MRFVRNQDLRWEQVDLEEGELRLPSTKTGLRTVSLSPRAVRVPQGIPRLSDSPWVIPGKIKGRPMRNLNDPWDAICERAGLEDTRIHDCRHSYASRALALGKGLPMIGRLLGHSEVQTTERYAHLDGQWVKESAEKISDIIGSRILSGYAGQMDRVSPRLGPGAPDEEAENLLSPFSTPYRPRTSTAA